MSLAQLSRLLPLPESELQQVLDYAATLSPQDAADHFNNFLGESAQSIEFISSFNSRRHAPASKPASQQTTPSDSGSGVPKSTRAPKKKKAPIHTPAPRQIQDTYAAQGTAYIKKDEDDYISKRSTPPRSSTPSNVSALEPKPEATQAPVPRPPPSAAGSLISDFKSKSNSSSRNASRTASPAPSKTKVNITGGTSMHGASTVLQELDAAIRSLEISTNSTLLDNERRKCNCIGARHPLLAAAPNCLNCGKVICVKEGLGPCTFCGTPLLSAVEVQGMIRELREERGREKMALDASSHRRAEVSKKPLPFTTPRGGETTLSPAEAKAKEHRDKLLGFQAQNAKRTTVRDEAADFETPMTALMSEKTKTSLRRAMEFPPREGKPEEFAALVTHSIENVMLNGVVIRLDVSPPPRTFAGGRTLVVLAVSSPVSEYRLELLLTMTCTGWHKNA